MERLREHDVGLRDGTLELRPFTEADWHVAEAWTTDSRVLRFSEGDDVQARSVGELQSIYLSISRTADIFLIFRDGVAVGDGWLQRTNLPRIVDTFGDTTARVDLQLAVDAWGQGIGTSAIRLLTAHGFERGFELVFGLDIADYNDRSRRAFLRAGSCRGGESRRLGRPRPASSTT